MSTGLPVLLACRLNVDAVLVCAHFPRNSLSPVPPVPCPQTPAQSDVHHATARQGSTPHASAQQEPTDPQTGLAAQPSDPPAGCTFCQVLSGLAELDVSAATALSAPTLALLLQGCSSLRRLGVVGCKNLGKEEGAKHLEAALAGMAARRWQHQQQDQGAGLPPSSCSRPSVSPVEAAAPRPSTTHWDPAAAAAAANAFNKPCPVQATIGQGLLRLAVGWGWSAGAISSVLSGAPHLISFTAGGVLSRLPPAC